METGERWLAGAGHSRAKADGTLTFAANCHQNCCRSQAAAVERLKPLHQDQDPSLVLSVSSAVAAGANLETIANLDPCQIHFLGSCSSKVAAVSAAYHHRFSGIVSVLLYVGSSRAEAGYVPSPGQHTQYTWPIFYECCL